jgi:hypothetical protein
VPTGTPTAIAPVTPNATTATYRPTRSAGASAAAVPNSTGVAAAAANAASTRNATSVG